MKRVLIAFFLFAATAGAAIAANLALLSYASSSNDPVGKLSPRANLPAAPADVIPPRTGPVHGDEADD